ncbi:hypothetical protein DFQ27_004597 [Actinomortierella ambigua]|uniref:CRAL-TRIO domain-containing protein n=1 Tax=Actinomortierella ambigua TaxID=1343610 RepID=A0A9P6U470_9FUNG|nr:hypothetical protein DFQ27_004597 [Actinomortierella ambigua]
MAPTTAPHDAVPQPGRLTPDQSAALGEMWSYLLYLWYSEAAPKAAAAPVSSENAGIADNQRPGPSSSSPPPQPASTVRKWKNLDVMGFLTNNDHDKFLPTARSNVSAHLSPFNTLYYHLHHQLQTTSPSSTTTTTTAIASATCAADAANDEDADSCINGLARSSDNCKERLATKTIQMQQRVASSSSSSSSSSCPSPVLKQWPLAAQGKFKYKYGATVYHDSFWAWVQNEHPDSILIRSLKARGWKAERAMEHLMLALEWRITYGLQEMYWMEEDQLDQRYPGFLYLLERGKIAIVGRDREGRPLAFGNPSVEGHPYHIALRMLVYFVIDCTRLLCRPPNDTFSGLIDLSDLSLSDVKLAPPSYISHADYNYGQMMGVGCVYKPPWIFYTAWKLASPFMDAKVRQNLGFMSKGEDLVTMFGDDVERFMRIPSDGSSEDGQPSSLSPPPLCDDTSNATQDGTDDPKSLSKKKKTNTRKETADSNHHHHHHHNNNTNKGKRKDGGLPSANSVQFNSPYVRPVPGENDLFHQDSKAKLRVIFRRKELELAFEEKTMDWLVNQHETTTTINSLIKERDELGYHAIDAFWAAEPYTRTRSVFHRLGKIEKQKPFFPSDSGIEAEDGGVEGEDLASLRSQQ